MIGPDLSKIRILLLLSLVILPVLAWAGDGETLLLRFPDIRGERIVFSYAGDLWTVSVNGGTASRLTSHPGVEWAPKFSPDGRWIAFTGEYDGAREVYAMPAEGGPPRRLSFMPDNPGVGDRMGPNNLVLGWTPDGKILFRSRRETWDHFNGRLYSVSPLGGIPTALPLPRGGLASFSPDGKKLAYNRTFREFRTWKRYRGGMATDVWIIDLASGKLEQLTDWRGQDSFPMWWKDKIYFLSDRGKNARSNLYSIDPVSKEIRQLTDFAEFDVRWPSQAEGKIIFENGGALHILDLASGKVNRLSIKVPTDFNWARPAIRSVADLRSEYEISPDGKRAALVARGDLFTIPAKDGPTRNLTNTPGAREKSISWSPDGKWIAYISDQSGEDEIWIAAQDGATPPRRVTQNGDRIRYAPVWSPDGKWLAIADKSQRLFIVDAATGQAKLVDQAILGEILEYAFSPDSRVLAFTRPDEKTDYFRGIWVYTLETGDKQQITDPMTDCSSPVWDPKGKYLFFLSNRDLNPLGGLFETDFVYRELARVYALPLTATTPSPFAPKSDEVQPVQPEAKDTKAGKPEPGKPEPTKTKVEVKIDFAGITNRAVPFPGEPAEIHNLAAAEDKVFFIAEAAPGTMTGIPTRTNALKVFDLEKREAKGLLDKVDGFLLSRDFKRILISKDGGYFLVDLGPTLDLSSGKLDLSGLRALVNPREEWAQIFNEAWRRQRDFFYVENMHGLDWPAIKQKYGQLLLHVAQRVDLNLLIGEMISELATGHSYVNGGDLPKFDSLAVGMLGADFEPDAAAGRIKIKHILRGQPWMPGREAPLDRPGVDIRDGDFILSIDGRNVDLSQPIEAYLLDRAGKQVKITVSDKPTGGTVREAIVVPTETEDQLRYFDWIEHNRRYVEQKTGGKIAYVHIPNMGPDGLNEFVRMFYPQIRKEGLIVDVRYNGGGFVSQMVLERLMRRAISFGTARNAGRTTTYPDATFLGPLVALCNQWSASDGDIFPSMFQRAKLGPVIGQRTWGGVVGIRGLAPFVDGGAMSVPEFGTMVPGSYIIENEGVTPDILVDNLPFDEEAGRDDQLDRAIAEVLKALAKPPTRMPEKPPEPVR